MRLAYLLFFLYLALFSWLLTRIAFFYNSGLPLQHVLLFFWIKVAAGVIYGYYYSVTAGGGDTWAYFQYSLQETALLRTAPLDFFTGILQSGYEEGYGNFFGVKNSWWNDLDANIIPKMLALCNLVTGNNYYCNVIFFNFLFLPGPLLLYRVWQREVPQLASLWRYLPFLLPSFLFWTSGIHKEGLLVIGSGLVVQAMYFTETQLQFTWIRSIQWMLGLLIIITLRNFLALPLLGACIAWSFANRSGLHPVVTFAGVLLLLALLFFGIRHFAPGLDLPKLVVERQAAFLREKGASKVNTFRLEPSLKSFIRNAPQAFSIAAFRPLPTDVRSIGIALAAIESTGLMLLLAAALFYFKEEVLHNTFLLFCFGFSLMVFLIIGYTIPLLGAVVRYRSIVLPFWCMPLLLVVFDHNKRKAKTEAAN